MNFPATWKASSDLHYKYFSLSPDWIKIRVSMNLNLTGVFSCFVLVFFLYMHPLTLSVILLISFGYNKVAIVIWLFLSDKMEKN